MQGGTSFGTKGSQWKWLPRMAGSQAQVAEAGEKLMAAAGGAMAPTSLNADISSSNDETSQQAVSSLPDLHHPRSAALRRILPNPERHYKLLAQVADTNFSLGEDEASDTRGGPVQTSFASSLVAQVAALTSGDGIQPTEEEGDTEAIKVDTSRRAAMCALAKLHIELDRNEAAREWGYAVGIFRLLHAGRMAKGDLIVGLPSECSVWKGLHDLLQLPS